MPSTSRNGPRERASAAASATQKAACVLCGTSPPFRVRELRQMRETDGKDPCFGQGFLWVLLASKRR
jgi:hypothetical protein